MDPFLFSLALAWLLVRGAEEVPYAIQGKTSPRMAAKLAKARTARAATGRPTTRRTAARDFFRNLWADAWDSADNTRRRSRDSRPQKKAEGRLLRQRAGRAAQAVGRAYKDIADWALNRKPPDLPDLDDPADFNRAAEAAHDGPSPDGTRSTEREAPPRCLWADGNPAVPPCPQPRLSRSTKPFCATHTREYERRTGESSTRPTPPPPPPPREQKTADPPPHEPDSPWSGVPRPPRWSWPVDSSGSASTPQDDAPPPPPPPDEDRRREPVRATATRLDDPPSWPSAAAGGEDLPVLDAEVVCDGNVSNPRLQLEAVNTNTEENTAMSSNAETTRINAAIAFATEMAAEARGGVTTMETFAQSLTAGEVTGKPLELTAAAQELYSQIAGVFAREQAELERHMVIAEQYAAVGNEAGSKAFNTDG